MFEQSDSITEPRFVSAAATFHSDAWGKAGDRDFYHRAWFAERGLGGDDDSVLDISGECLVSPAIPKPDLAIALANPCDPPSWNAALAECRRAKSSGAFPLLLAAYASPRFDAPIDKRMLQSIFREDCPQSVDAIIKFCSKDIYTRAADLVYSLTHLDGLLQNLDYEDIFSVLRGCSHAIAVSGTARGTGRAARAAEHACQELAQPIIRERLRGGITFIEIGTGFGYQLQEYFEVMETIGPYFGAEAKGVTGMIGRRDTNAELTVDIIATLGATPIEGEGC
jgi:hypothetical protein